MDFIDFVRKPFRIKAVEITAENIEEIAKSVGDLRFKDDEPQTPFILVDPRLVPNVDRAYIGFFMTKMGDNIRCYSRRIFNEQFIEESEEIRPWLEFMDNKTSA